MLENGPESVEVPVGPAAPAIFVDNRRLGRFELWHDEVLVSFAEYYGSEQRIVMPYVETALAYRGRGYASALIEAVLTQVRRTGASVQPVSTFVANYILTHAEHRDLVVRA